MFKVGRSSEILADLGLDAGAAQALTPATARLTDETNKDWIRKFLAKAF